MFFREEGKVSMHTVPKGGVILTKNLKEGNYVLKNNTLIITWADKTAENDKIKFIDKNSFQITLANKQNKNGKRVIVFRKVVDEEIIEDKV